MYANSTTYNQDSCQGLSLRVRLLLFPFPSLLSPLFIHFPPPLLLSPFLSFLPKSNWWVWECCKLPHRGLERSPGRKRILTHIGLSKRMPWQHFSFVYMQCNASCKWLFSSIGICRIAELVLFLCSEKIFPKILGVQPVTPIPLKYGHAYSLQCTT